MPRPMRLRWVHRSSWCTIYIFTRHGCSLYWESGSETCITHNVQKYWNAYNGMVSSSTTHRCPLTVHCLEAKIWLLPPPLTQVTSQGTLTLSAIHTIHYPLFWVFLISFVSFLLVVEYTLFPSSWLYVVHLHAIHQIYYIVNHKTNVEGRECTKDFFWMKIKWHRAGIRWKETKEKH